MRRVVVIGGLGHFGRTIVAELAKFGIAAQAASRTAAAQIQCNAEDPASLRAVLRKGDVVIDAAGPFHLRTTVLLEAAMEIGCDVIDLNDYLAYAEELIALRPRIETAGIRVLTSASTVSAIAAAVVRRSGVDSPVRINGCLAPASRRSANPAAALSLLRSVGQPTTIWRDGRRQTVLGWGEPKQFAMPSPIGTICGKLFETADVAYLPQIWPSAREVTMRVAPNAAGLMMLLNWAAHLPWLRSMLQSQIQIGAGIARRFGSLAGGVGYEIEDTRGRCQRWAIVASEGGYLVAIAPAVLAAREICHNRFQPRGLVPPDLHVPVDDLADYLTKAGIAWQALD